MERLKPESTIYHEIISDMSIPVCCFEPNGCIVFKNEPFSKIFAISNAEVTGQNFFDIFDKTETQNIRVDLKKLTAGCPTSIFRHSFLGVDQKVHWYDLNSQAIFNEKQETIEYRCLGLDCTDQQEETEKLKKISLRDELTGLYNRHFVVEELIRLDSERQKRPYSVIFCDLNDLKKINDNSPEKHLAGDKLLKNTAKTIHKNCRDSDLVARWGGDEFLIVLPETTTKRATIIRDRIVKSCQEKNISLATGIAQKETTENHSQVIDRADHEMYLNKEKMKRATLSSI